MVVSTNSSVLGKRDISLSEWILGTIDPMSERNAIDPFAVKTHSKLSPLRIVWTMQSRLLERAAKRRRDLPVVNIPPDISKLVLFQDRGQLWLTPQ